MRHFDELVNTLLYEKMDRKQQEDLRVAYDLLCSDSSGLGNNTVEVKNIDPENVRAFTNNVVCNYSRFVYMQKDIYLLCQFLQIPMDRYEFMKTVVNLEASCVHGVSSVWKD